MRTRPLRRGHLSTTLYNSTILVKKRLQVNRKLLATLPNNMQCWLAKNGATIEKLLQQQERVQAHNAKVIEKGAVKLVLVVGGEEVNNGRDEASPQKDCLEGVEEDECKRQQVSATEHGQYLEQLEGDEDDAEGGHTSTVHGD